MRCFPVMRRAWGERKKDVFPQYERSCAAYQPPPFRPSRGGAPVSPERARALVQKGERGAACACLGKALVLKTAGDLAGAERNCSLAVAAWPELISTACERLNLPRSGFARAHMERIIEYTLEMCGGYRRVDRYLLPLVLGAGAAGRRAII